MIKEYRVYSPMEQQRTLSALGNADLQHRRDSEAGNLIPRSQGSWGAEQQRLGSWHSGVGAITPPGVGNMYKVGQGKYTPVGIGAYQEMGRSADTVGMLRASQFASMSDQEKDQWRA